MARKDIDMTRGDSLRQIISFALPLTLGLLFQQLYSAVDMVVVGNFVGKEALAAVGCTTSIVNMLIGVCNGLSLGAGAVISQACGAKDNKAIHDAVHTTIAATFILCVIATIIGMFITSPALRMMDTPDDVLGPATTYLTIYFAGIAGLLVYNMGSAILRAVGDSVRPLYFLIFSAFLNTVLDLVFVQLFHLGVAGVSLATILAQGISAVLVLVVLSRDQRAYGLRWRHIRIWINPMKKIFLIGFPSSIQQGLTSFSNVYVQSYINAFGSACMSGWSNYNKLDGFLMVPVMALAQASTTFVGQNWGAGQPERAREGVNTALKLSIACTAILSVLMLLLARPLLRIISPDEDVINFGVRFIYIITPFYLTISFNQMYGGALRGVGDATRPMLIMLFSFVLFRQIYLKVSTMYGGGFLAVALAYPLGWVVCSVLLAICYRRSVLFRQMQPKKA